jgi:rRNA maturation endonuclease Nob1
MGSCLDLRKYQNDPNMSAVMGKLLSGKSGYKAVIERKIEPIKCSKCRTILEQGTKFCPECGTRVEIKK